MWLAIAFIIHVLSAVIWVGGMFFAYMALRPAAAATLDASQRLILWSATLKRFFPWVWTAILLLLLSGFGIIHLYGGMGKVGPHVHLMLGTGILMMLLFMHLFFAPYRRLHKAVMMADYSTAGKQLNQIRLMISINLLLGLITVVIGSAGKFIQITS